MTRMSDPDSMLVFGCWLFLITVAIALFAAWEWRSGRAHELEILRIQQGHHTQEKP